MESFRQPINYRKSFVLYLSFGILFEAVAAAAIDNEKKSIVCLCTFDIIGILSRNKKPPKFSSNDA